MITVVIPYFQRSAGVLRKALASIVAQKGCPLPIHIIVVDDASPISAEAEVDSINFPQGMTIRIIKQENSGPGAARNSGLNEAPPTTRYIAFLDSDDEWSPDHLARATQGLESGFDFYFADHYQLDAQVSAFARAGKLKMDDHPSVPLSDVDLHAYQGDMVDQIIRGNVIGTSTVVYRWPGFSELRFRIDYTSAGEDYLFWLGLVRSKAKFVFSNQVEATYGRGVNIYSGAVWGSTEHMLRVHNELKYRKALLQEFSKGPEQAEFLRKAIHILRRDFINDLLYKIKNKKSLPFRLTARHFRSDLTSLFLFPKLIHEITKKKQH